MASNPIFKSRLAAVFCLLLLVATKLFGQEIPKYTLDAYWDEANQAFNIQQKIRFKNTCECTLDRILLNDWANAYSSTKSPLAVRLAEEFNRSFYLSQKSKRGYTALENIKINSQTVQWTRQDPQLDIIALSLEQPLASGDSLEIDLKYFIKLPDGKFTGYGKLKKETYFLENFFITLADFQDGQWKKMSNLDLEDIPYGILDIDIRMHLPKYFNVFSNLIPVHTTALEKNILHAFQGKASREMIFHFGKELEYKHYQTENGTFISDFDNENLNEAAAQFSLTRVQKHVNDFLGPTAQRVQLLSKIKYNKRPFLGLTLLPSSFLAYPSQFQFEIETLSVLLRSRIKEKLNTPNRADFWFTEGLHFYLLKAYVEKHYPEKKALGNLLKLPIIKNLGKLYYLSELKFKDGFREYVEFTHRRNLQQSNFLHKEELIKFNERMGQPSQNALLMDYLERSLNFELKDFTEKAIDLRWSGEHLKNEFISAQRIEYQDQISDLMHQRTTVDLKIKKLKIDKDSIAFTVEEKSGRNLPFEIALTGKDSTHYQATFYPTQKNSRLKISKKKSDYVNVRYPSLAEFNPRNNVKKINGIGKPFKFTFVKDIEDPYKNQIFYNPRLDFNIYDGVSFGIRLNNKTIKSRPLTVVAQPIYSSLEKTLIGLFAASYVKYKENSRNHFTQFGFAANSFHYDKGLRYTLFLPYLNFYLRNNALRDNKRELISLAGYHVNREQNTNTLTNPNYNIVSLSYLFSKNEAIDYFTFKTGLQGSDRFGKVETTTEFRKLLRSGRQFSFRAYAGKFLWHNTTSQFFDFSLNRPNDYLFQYDYLGRSEETGIYSQQFIMAEGGFKIDIPQPFADDFILATNFSMGIWKYFEAYGDWAMIKRRNQAAKGYFDTGLRLNLLPDYLELYFPVYSSVGWAFDAGNYASKIRFVITLEPRSLIGLFSRKWF